MAAGSFWANRRLELVFVRVCGSLGCEGKLPGRPETLRCPLEMGHHAQQRDVKKVMSDST